MAEPNRSNSSSSKSGATPMNFGPGGMRRGPGGPRGMMMMTREKPKNMGVTLKKLFSYIGKSRYLVLSLLLVMLFVTLLSLAGPALQGAAIDTITLSDSKLHVNFSALAKTLGLMASVYAVSSLLTYFQGVMAAKLSQGTVYKMRRDLFDKIERLPLKYIDAHPHGDLMSRMTNDVDNISQTVSSSIGSLFSGVLTMIGTLFIMLWYSPLLTLIAMITIPLTILVSTQMSKLMRKYFVRQQTLLGSLNGHIEEMVTGYKTVVAFGYEKRAESEFLAISDELKKTGIRANIFGGVMGPMMNVIGNLSYLLIAAFGGYFALSGFITVGTIQAFLIYSRQFTRPVNEIANLYAQIITAIAGAERVFSVMDQENEPDRGSISLAPESIRGRICFENVIFSYKQGEPVLKGFDLTVEPGQKVAIVGATGAGKTTVVNLLTRFYEIDSGRITLDGADITDIRKDDLRRNIAIVLQDTVLFSDTIGNNIRYGKLEADAASVAQAAKTSNADVFISRLPDGYDTELSASGDNLSGGQRQLLSIARAVLADPKILILDEATSSVDTRTEMHIQEAMIKLMKNRTSLIIAHRLSTIRDADVIIVMENGKVAESGSHTALMEKQGAYFRLYQTQFAGNKT